MAVTVGDLVAFLRLNDRDFELGLQQAQAKLRAFDSGLDRVAAGMSEAGRAAAAATVPVKKTAEAALVTSRHFKLAGTAAALAGIQTRGLAGALSSLFTLGLNPAVLGFIAIGSAIGFFVRKQQEAKKALKEAIESIREQRMELAKLRTSAEQFPILQSRVKEIELGNKVTEAQEKLNERVREWNALHAQGLASQSLEKFTEKQRKSLELAQQQLDIQRQITIETRASGNVQGPSLEGGNPVVTLSYGGASAPYAIFVHENLMARHNAPTQAKFLEEPFKRAAKGLVGRLALRTRRVIEGLARR